MSQIFTAIDKLGPNQDAGVALFIATENALSISEGTAIQLSGTESATGTNTSASRFKDSFDDDVTYYVVGFSDPGGNPRFNLATTPDGTAIQIAGAPGFTSPTHSFSIDDPGEVSFSLAGAICFLGNTSVNTDQGKVKFNELTTKNTINKHQIKKVVSVMNKDNTMVLIKKNSLGDFIPNKDTYISNNHKILIDGNYFEAKNIVNNFNIHKKKMPRKRLYNVLLDHHGTMIVNNMVVETLDPNNKFAH